MAMSIQGSLPEWTPVLKYGWLLSTLPTNMTLKYEETVCLEKETVKEVVSQKLEDNRRSVACFLVRFLNPLHVVCLSHYHRFPLLLLRSYVQSGRWYWKIFFDSC